MNPECEPSESQSQRLPDTCPISQTDLSQQLVWNSQNVQKPWGRLYPTVSDVPSLGEFYSEIFFLHQMSVQT